MIQRFADRENDVTYKTQFQGHFKGVCNRNLRKIVLNSVIINTLHVGIYMIELFYKAAITSAVWYVIHEWTKFEHCIASIGAYSKQIIESYQR